MKTPGQKRAATNKKNNPNYYSDIAKKRKKPFSYFSWLKQSDPERLKMIQKKGGKKIPEILPPGFLN